jgi:hypothetical protein
MNRPAIAGDAGFEYLFLWDLVSRYFPKLLELNRYSMLSRGIQPCPIEHVETFFLETFPY